MAALQPVVVQYCVKCGLPPEFCEWNTEVDHGGAAAAAPPAVATAAAAAALRDLSVGEGPAADGQPVGDGVRAVIYIFLLYL